MLSDRICVETIQYGEHDKYLMDPHHADIEVICKTPRTSLTNINQLKILVGASSDWVPESCKQNFSIQCE
jgi:hypothetical protein